jgi:hypothetical protein
LEDKNARFFCSTIPFWKRESACSKGKGTCPDKELAEAIIKKMNSRYGILSELIKVKQ